MTIRDRVPCCIHSDKAGLSDRLLTALLMIEMIIGHELQYTSGLRCPECNKKAGGEVNSAHLFGLAADAVCIDSRTRYRVIGALYQLGIQRYGPDHSFLHIDVDKDLPQEVCWLY